VKHVIISVILPHKIRGLWEEIGNRYNYEIN